ncbi:hypothetical protein F8203_gp162 [Heliothis virescens ascovirus 3f]|uniref:folate gamma-glutamyl hydrolase n=1 Tax=Heliothis virescens ascovirus 3f TaxID=328614 RepID=A0A171PVP6_9VIRU|nr:hypothetical protein F8203_gp162 [Heliothis virescens ascovirus 3f]AJP09128.1 hypothetical protein [Heliothis virescens ascovirus 3f]
MLNVLTLLLFVASRMYPFVSSKSIVIGILAQRCHTNLTQCSGHDESKNYIVASYVKAIEASGAQVIPVLSSIRDEEYYRDIARTVNGILLPGGKILDEEYEKAVKFLVRASKTLYDRHNISLPILGVCLGMGALLYDEFGETIRTNSACSAHQNEPLRFTHDYENGRLFKNAYEHSRKCVESFETTPLAIQANTHCITEKVINDVNMKRTWHVSSYTFDDDGIKHAATVEHRVYPLFGVSFHPEKSAFETSEPRFSTHFPVALQCNRYFYDFFIEYASNNNNTTVDIVQKSIFNYPVVYSSASGCYFKQTYVF